MVTEKRFIMIAGRTTKQGRQVNVGKDAVEYEDLVTSLTMNPDDIKDVGVSAGDTVMVRSETGEGRFQCEEGNVPAGIIFVPYGPPTCRLMGHNTDGTGMPTSKGWEVEVTKIDDADSKNNKQAIT